MRAGIIAAGAIGVSDPRSACVGGRGAFGGTPLVLVGLLPETARRWRLEIEPRLDPAVYAMTWRSA